MIHSGFIYVGAFICDTLFGDPGKNVHPVVLIGKLISFLEKRLLDAKQSSAQKKSAGLFLAVLTVGIVYLTVYAAIYLLGFAGSTVLYLSSALMLSFTISPRTLKTAAQEIRLLLDTGDIVQAREKVGWIVGRDTGNLDESEVTRATVETVAENITDGIISPLFFAALGGVPLAFAYRAVNTLDSMVGYKNDKYIDFGMVPARIDDVFNFIPARITAVLIVFAAFILPGYNGANAFQMLWRDAGKHPSPNSGFAEATAAGALNIRLGGTNYYFGRASFREYMGEPIEQMSSLHIGKIIRLMYAVTIIFILILVFI